LTAFGRLLTPAAADPRQLKRRQALAFFQNLPSCMVGIEACASSHYWSLAMQAVGHIVRLMPPAYLKPYVERRRDDLWGGHPGRHAVRAD
jgi:transposase